MYIVLVATVAITVLTTKEQVAKVKVHAPVKWKSVLLSYWGPLKGKNGVNSVFYSVQCELLYF